MPDREPAGVAGARASARADRLRSRLRLPDDWRIDAPVGPGPFVTAATLTRPDGTALRWRSRDHRKHAPALGAQRGSTWWAPGAVGWWIGALFAVGSLCFAVGAVPGYATAVGLTADGVTFFVGSLFFTSAAALQYLEVANTRVGVPGARPPRHRHLVTWEPDRVDWWAGAVQLVGTLFFNVSTYAALHAATVQQMNRRVWTPDALGSACFLVASWLAWTEVCHGRWSWPPDGYSWWIGALNLAGSVAFGASAVGSYIVPTTSQARNPALMTLGTFLGAIAFLVGGLLLWPERTSGTPDGASGDGGRAGHAGL